MGLSAKEWFVAAVFTGGLAWGLVAFLSDDKPSATPKTERPCVVEATASTGRAIVFPTKAGFDEAIRASAVGDTIGYGNAVTAHGAFTVEGGTTCLRLLERDHVRFTSGEHTGRDGWLPREWSGLE